METPTQPDASNVPQAFPHTNVHAAPPGSVISPQSTPTAEIVQAPVVSIQEPATITPPFPAEPAAITETESFVAPVELSTDLPPIPTHHLDELAAEPVTPVTLAAPASVEVSPVPRDIAVEAIVSEQTVSPAPPTVTPSLAYEPAELEPDAMPDTREMELDRPIEKVTSDAPVDKGKFVKTAVGVFIVIVAGLFIKTNSSTLGPHKLTSKEGYTYSFKFYRNSELVTYGDGTKVLKHANDSVGSVKPTITEDVSNCTKVGNGWRDVFNATINGTTVPVCTPDHKTYIAVFSGAGHKQLFTVSYDAVQKPESQPTLKAIFESVSVKK